MGNTTSTTSYNQSGGELPPDCLARLKVSVPGYKLLHEIGRGGQAVVYKAIQESTGKSVAVKLLREGILADGIARERLEREVRVLATLNHKNIVAVIDSGETNDGHAFLVMSFVDGRPLDTLFPNLANDSATYDSSLLLNLFLKICDAIGLAHLQGVTHRDLSPNNILIDYDNEPFILDFGLARTAFDRFFNAQKDNLTVSNQFLGKIAYASPEQARGRPDQIDVRTDVYALGVILYQILTGGEFPYEVVGSVADVLNNIIHIKPTPPSKCLEAQQAALTASRRLYRRSHPAVVNPIIEAIVLKALEKRPSDRYQSAGELAQDIRRYQLGQPTVARVFSETYLARPSETSIATILAVIGLLLSALMFSVTLIWFTNRPTPSTHVSRQVSRREASASPSSTTSPPMRPETQVESIVNAAERPTNPAQQMDASIDKDESEALKHYQIAAEAGDTGAMCLLGLMHESGRGGLEKNAAEAINWYRKAADAGDGRAMAYLGLMYQNGIGGLARNEAKAVELYQKGAAVGSRSAMASLGAAYADGTGGLKKDDTIARDWFVKGAEMGDATCMWRLGIFYDLGRGGLPEDHAAAVKWYRQSARLGVPGAQVALQERGLSW